MPRPDVSEQRKAEILAAAAAVFGEKGQVNARMEDIAAAAGLSKGTLYWYFESKEAIIAAMQQEMIDAQLNFFASLLEIEGPVSQRLRQFVQFTLAQYEQLESVRPLMYELMAEVGRSPETRTALGTAFDQGLDILKALLREGVARGEFRADLDLELTALMLTAVHEGLELLWMLSPQRIDLPAAKEHAVNVLLGQIRNQEH